MLDLLFYFNVLRGCKRHLNGTYRVVLTAEYLFNLPFLCRSAFFDTQDELLDELRIRALRLLKKLA